ncbi:MAG: stage II sporulation protein M [bacterium]|nr:stage II sporulation protein M [bacterium]
MKQQHFEHRYQQDWQRLETALADAKANLGQDFPQRYRHLCHQLALAKQRRYSPQLVNRLNHLVLLSHHHFYQHNVRYRYQFLRFVVWGFPTALRTNATYVWGAAILFVLPLLIMGLGSYVNEELIFSLMSPAEVRHVEEMYDPSAKIIGRVRQSDTDLMMFGYYIKNNIGIGFRTFASGILFGIGAIFILLYNGLFIGGIAGHLTQVGFANTFYPFVIGHGAFELTAIVFSGAAGLKLGFALLAPGAYRRVDALRNAAREAVQIVYGAMLMLVIAAFLEAFWSSSSTIPNLVKYSVGAVCWLFVMGYCFFAGRAYGSQPD